jgi:hypothetical protein
MWRIAVYIVMYGAEHDREVVIEKTQKNAASASLFGNNCGS